MWRLNSVAANWQISEGIIVSGADRDTIHRSLTGLWEVKCPFDFCMFPVVNYHSAPTRLCRRWNIQHLWGRAGFPGDTDSPNTQACASEPSTSIRTAHLFSALIEANGSEAHACMLCGDKTWGAIVFWGCFGCKHTDLLNWLENPWRHTHFMILSCPENQGIRKQNSFSIMLDNGWKGKIHMILHNFTWNHSLRSIWPLINATTCYNKTCKFVYSFTYLLDGIII